MIGGSGREADAPAVRRGGRWDVVRAESLEELASALNVRGVTPDRLAHLVSSVVSKPGDEAAAAGAEAAKPWEALVWLP